MSVEELAAFVDGPAAIVEAVDELVRDDPDADPPREGWTWILDPEATPVEWLPWLGQFVGVRPRRGLGEEGKRVRVLEAAGKRRGSVAAIRGAARQHLTGGRYVSLEERTDGDGNEAAYHLRVTTFIGQTPDAVIVEASLQDAKPAGLILHYQAVVAGSYADRMEEFGTLTYGDTPGGHATYQESSEWVPPEE